MCSSSTIKMRFVFILLVAAIHCKTSMFNERRCSEAAAGIIQASTLPCTEICQDDPRNHLREKCSWNSNQGEPCMTMTATVTRRVTYAPLVVTITPTCSPLLVASSLATRAPQCITTVITEYSSITPTNCLQSTHAKEMSTTVRTGDIMSGLAMVGTVSTLPCTGYANCSTVRENLNTATCNCSIMTATTGTATRGDTNNSQGAGTTLPSTGNNSPVILGAFIAVLAALLVAVTTGWIVTCVLNTRKNKASTTSNKNNALQNPVYDSQHVQRYQGNPSARTQIGYSSQGPAYDQVGVDTGTNYDVIDRRGPRPQTTPPDQYYSTLDSDEQEHDYHELESTNAGGPIAVGGQEPQDYEIPLRKM